MTKDSCKDYGFADIVAKCLANINVTVNELYHYTSTQSLMGILNSRELWLSEHSYLKDYNELANGIRILIDLLRENRGIDYIDVIYNSSEQDMELALLSKLCYSTFIFSLSEDDDSKSQWFEYGDGYKGICLGFSHDKFLNEVLNSEYAIHYKSSNLNLHYNERTLFSKAIYDDLKKKELLKEILDRSIEVASKIPKSVSVTDKQAKFQEIFTSALWVILKLIPLFKNSSFYEEREHRLVIQFPIRSIGSIHTSLEDIDYRVVNGVVMPYYRFRFKTLDQIVKSIKVGPMYKDHKCIYTLEELFQKKGITKASFNVSNIPIQ